LPHLTALFQQLATRHCPGHLVFILEGGYNLIGLARGVHTVLEVLAGAEPPPLGQLGMAEVEKAAAYHRDAFLPTDTA
jgi:acetoin utilization deacetylase AcuC-like enzyme